MRSGSQKAACRFHHVARPDEMITAQIIVAFIESPRNAEAGDDTARLSFGLVGPQYGEADPFKGARTGSTLLQRSALLHPFLPAGDIVVLRLLKTVAKASDSIPCCFFGVITKPEC